MPAMLLSRQPCFRIAEPPPAGFRLAGPIKTQTSIIFFPTSIPAHCSTFTSSIALSLRREADASLFSLPLGLCLLQSEVRLRQPATLHNGGLPPLTMRGHLSSRSQFARCKCFGQAASFSSSEVAPQGHEPLHK